LAVLFIVLKINFQKQNTRDFNQENIQAVASETVSFIEVEPISENDHLWGDIDAPVQMIIYDDFECPFCLKFYSTTKKINEEFGDQIVIAYRHNPLPYHAMAMIMAMAAECADEQGQFWQMYDKLFEANQNRKINSEQIKSDAESLGLDMAQFTQCLESEKYRDKIIAQMLAGKTAGAIGTPTIFLNGKLLPGAVPFEDYIGRDGQSYQGIKSQINSRLESL
jgi:protein-disulfide isomerase